MPTVTGEYALFFYSNNAPFPRTASAFLSRAAELSNSDLYVLADPALRKERIPTLLALLETSDAEIIALQEVTPWLLQELKRKQWFGNYHAPDLADKVICPGGLLILSKNKIDNVEFGHLPSRQNRAFLKVDTSIAGRTFTIAACHLDSPLKAGAIRSKQLDSLFEKLKEKTNAILLGDFNFGDDEMPETTHLRKQYKDAWK